MEFKKTGNTLEKFLFENFWEKDIKNVDPIFSLMYLYAVRCAAGGVKISVSDFADKFSSGENTVFEAFSFWAEKGLLNFDKEKELVLFTAQELNTRDTSLEKNVFETCSDGKSSYMALCEKKLGRALSFTEIEIFDNMRDWMGLPEEVIFILIDYCKVKGKARIKYMEKAALDWQEKGIASEEAALEYIHMMDYEFTDILKALGKSGFSPTKTDEKYFVKWLKEMEMPLEIVLEACEKTVESTGKASLKYADKILENWKAESVKTKEDIERLDNLFRENKEKGRTDPLQENQKGGNLPYKKEWKNRFVNFPQRQWDFEEIAKAEEKRREKNS